MTRIIHIALQGISHIHFKPQLQQEYEATRRDLLAENHFRLCGESDKNTGPYRLNMECKESRLCLDIENNRGEITKIQIPMSPFRHIIKDYFYICESYYSTMFSHHPARIEPIDMARRGLHNEGADKLRHWLQKEVEMDNDTARRLFTFLCILHMR